MSVPEIRHVDPDAEGARLAQDRQQATAMAHWPPLLDEVHQVARDDGGPIWLAVTVRASEFRALPAGLGTRIADLIREALPE